MYLPFTVCAAECEAAEAQSDDEAYTLQVPKHSEGKTKVIRKSSVEIVSTVYGIETRRLLLLLLDMLALQQHLLFPVCFKAC